MTKPPFFHREQLNQIRRSADWRRLFLVLGIEKDPALSKPDDWWGKSPFQPTERTASFHMNDKGWYCHATHTVAPGRDNPGGGVIELVQAIHATRGRIMKLNEAAQWLIDQGVVGGVTGDAAPDTGGEPTPEPAKAEPPKPNKPIAVDLVPLLKQQGEHPEFQRRGIGAETCRYLRCGLLPESRSPLKGRLVFQVGGMIERPDGTLVRAILSHMGRATDDAQTDAHGKWWVYAGFNKSLELYNLDNLLSDPLAAEQARATGHVLLVEGPFDVAKLVEAGIRNVAATMGAHLSPHQLPRLDLIKRRLGVDRAVIWYDRDKAGNRAVNEAMGLLARSGWQAAPFDWSVTFPSPRRGAVPVPDSVKDPCDFSVDQLRWLRTKGLI